MSFTKLMKCCFPMDRNEIIKNQEENYDIKYTSEEKKIEGGKAVMTSNIKEKEEEEKELLNKFHGDAGPHSKSNNLGGTKGAMEESFSSFGNKPEGNAKGASSDHTSFLKHVNSDKKNDKPDIPLPTQNQSASAASNLPAREEIPKGASQTSLNPNSSYQQQAAANNNNNVNTSITKSHKNYEDSTLEGIGSARKISDEDIKNAPTLLLEEVTGEVLKNNKLRINAGGLTNGLRKAKDGVAFFGKNFDAIINDFDLNLDSGIDYGPHSFMIYFKKDTNKFYIKSYRDKQHTGQVHIKIDPQNDLFMLKKEIVLLSETYFQITPHSDGKIEIQNLGFSNKDSESTKFTFDSSENKQITIGRDSKCTMPYPTDKSFSKVQATISWDADRRQWKLKDGSADKASTNGCWIYATHSYEILDNTIFQFGSSRFKISISK